MRLLTLNIDGINQLVNDYDRESKALKEELFRLCWYMRGMGPAEAYMLSYEDRVIIGKIVEKNLEITKESGQPFF
jgi:hypothetical protein